MGNKVNKYGFSAKSNCDDVLKDKDFTNKNIVLTGATSGIGKMTLKHFFSRNANVYIFCRNKEKMESVEKEFSKFKKENNLYCITCNLGSQKDIERCVKEFTKDYCETKFDLMILNAGIMKTTKTWDGFETMIGVNHFGHFTLSLGILSMMKDPSRIVVVASGAHTFGKCDLSDLEFNKRKFKPFVAYGQSKTANILFTKELNRMLMLSGKKITVNCLHPGAVPTNLGSGNKFFTTLKPLVHVGMKIFGKSVSQGAATTCFVATEEKLEGKGGLYFDNCDESEVLEYASNMETARKLFEISLKRTNAVYPFEMKKVKEEKEGTRKDSIEIKEENEKDEIIEEKKENS